MLIYVKCMCLYRKLNIMPNSRSNQLHSLHLCGTVGTCGHCNADAGASLLSCVCVISKNDISALSDTQCRGSGRFGTCFLWPFSHYSVFEKVFKHSNNAVKQTFLQHLLTSVCHTFLECALVIIITSFHGLTL